jgi:hypothetical protein
MNFLRKLTGYRSRMTYWSNSKLSYKIQQLAGMERDPVAASSKEWRLRDEAKKKVSPVVYWITEEGFDIVQNTLYFPYDVYRNTHAKLHNIFISKTHYIVTKLPKGQWHESDTRIMHGLCELLVDFVETEKAHMYDLGKVWDEDNSFVVIKDRREAGLKYLDWEISLVHEKGELREENYDLIGKPTSQAKGAKNIKEIYLWWKDVRPNRPDPMDISGWSEYCATKKDMFDPEEDEEKHKQVRVMLDTITKIEKTYNDEDTEMLTRIIKGRRGMWT